MATTIDQKVVEMKFDNRDFERNTKQSMSTLDKLKSKLNFSGASKGLEEVGKATKKVDMGGLATGISTVQAKFSAMEVIGVTALANITNSAVNAGKNIVRSLTIAPVSDGFNEYEMTLNAIQTTMAGTGKTAAEVQEQLKLLDEYADKTVYSTADMLSNLPKFTNAGVELETATTAMIGIANATALAGGDASKASIAFYNLGQAIGTGYLTRMDYNSINNAGIATMEWKQQMVDAAIAAGTLTKAGDNLYKAGNRTMTLQQLFIDGLQEQWATTDVMLKVFGDYGNETTAIGKKAYAAAQDIKTFSMMMESLKATAGTGWKDTWQIIFGDLDQAKEMWTGLTNFIGRIINSMANLRNEFLGNAFNFDGFQKVMDKINNNSVVKTMSDISEKVKTTSRSLEEYQGVVSKVWRGDYNNRGDNPDRFDLLAKDGWNANVVQSLVNKGSQYKLTIDDCKKAEEKYGITVKETTVFEEKKIETTKELTKEKLKELGLSDEEIKMYGQLEEASKKYGISIDDLLDKMKKSTGRDLLFGKKKRNQDGTVATDDSGNEMYETVGVAQNIAAALSNIFSSIKKAWNETFKGMSSIDLYMIFENINKFSLAIKKATENEKGMRNLTDTFKGLFSILKLISTLVGGGIKIAWTIFKTVLQTCGVSVLDFTGAVGNMVSGLVDFITENEFVINGIVWLTKAIAGGIVSVYKWISSFISINDALHAFQNGLKKAKENFSEWVKGLKDADNIPKYIIDGLVNGIKKYGGKAWKAITNFVITFVNKVKELLGIHSPSIEFFDIGKNIILGLFNGISAFVSMVYNLLMTVGEKIIDIVKGMDFGSLFVAIISTGAIVALLRMAKALSVFSDGLQNVNGVINEARKVMKSFRGVLNAFKIKIITSALKEIAVAIAILVGSIVVLTMLDTGKVWASIGAIAALVILLGGLTAVAGVFGKKDALQFGKLALTIIAIGIAMSLMASAFRKISKIKNISLSAIVAFGAMIAGLFVVIKALNSKSGEVAKVGGAILAIGVALMLMARVVKYLGNLSIPVLIQGTIAMGIFAAMIGALIFLARMAGDGQELKGLGKVIGKVGITLVLMALVCRLLGGMDIGSLIKGTIAIGLFATMIGALILAISFIDDAKDINKLGKAIKGVGVAILMMGLTVKLLGGMDIKSLVKGGACIALFAYLILQLFKEMDKIGAKDVSSIGKAMMGISATILAMALSVALLGLISLGNLIKGVAAVGMLSLFMMGLIKATEGTHIVSYKTMLTLVAAIGVLALAVGLLSIIDPKRLIGPTVAMSLLMGIFSIMIKSAKQLEGAKGLIKNLAVMIVTIALLGGIVTGLSFINAGNALKASKSILLLITGLTACMFALQKMGKLNIKNVATQIGGMIAVLGVMLLATQVLKQLNGLGNVTEGALALAILMGTLTVVLIALGAIGSLTSKALIGIVGLMGLMVTLCMAVDVLNQMSNVQNAMASATALVLFMGGLTLILLMTAAVGAIYLATVGIGATGLIGLLAIIPMCSMLIDILTKMNNVQNAEANVLLLTTLLSVMTEMLFKISIVGPLALIAIPALYALMSIMPMMIAFAAILGALVTYIPSLQTFIDTGLPIMIQVAGGIGEMIGAFVSGALTQISNALPVIGTNLSLFMNNSKPFIAGMKSVNGQVLKGTGIMTGAILALTAAQLINSIVSFLSLGNNFSSLGLELSRFAVNAMPFLTIMSVVPPAAMNGVKSLASAVLTLTAANLLDGISRFFGGGGSSLSAFGAQLPPLGAAMAGFVGNLGVFNEDQVNTTDCAGRAITALADAAKKLPKTGGWVQKLFGEGSLADFAAQMPGVATGVVGFVGNLGIFGSDQIATSNAACEVIKALAEAAKVVGNDGGFWQGLFGSKNDGLAKFAKNMPGVGDGVKGFIEKLEPVKDKADVAKSGAEIIQGIAKLADIDFDKANDKLPKFGDTMIGYGDKLKTFIEKLKGFTKEDVEAANNNLTLVTTAAQNMMSAIGDEITDNSGNITTNMIEVAKKASEGIASDDVIKNVKNKAKDFVQGFANGIKSEENLKLAREAGIVLGREADKGVAIGTDEHSPSKIAMHRGEYFGEGFIIGIEEYSSRVYKVSEGIGEQAKRGLTSAVSRMSSVIDSDMDTNPTIRPVLDLSEVSDGASKIGSMFNNPSLQVMSNLDAISSGVNARIQNGSNPDVVSAINKLGKNLGTSTGNTYNINGITYEGDSAINDAVLGLIKAIEIERRV